MSRTIPSTEKSCCGPPCCEDEVASAVNNHHSTVEESPDGVKQLVKGQYTEIAQKAGTEAQKSCCGPDCRGDGGVMVMADDYSNLDGYVPEADLGLGCGTPTDYAKIKPGETVLDLGSGAGNDVFIVRSILGETGKVIGVDMTEAMVERARQNNVRLGFQNVEFVLGDIESLPLASESVNVVLSNCVLNLVPNKEKAFSEIYRVLRPDGRFSISDIVTTGELPQKIRTAVEMYAGCIGGALVKEHYLATLEATGFKNVAVVKEKPIAIPEQTLRRYLDDAEITVYQNSRVGILSITVYGEKGTSARAGLPS
ncbi:MAG TPA: arsenite methyltransferase [Bacteroidota bacterium]|nr:arsenite methyltransferase [Bacteroidota bacterium]